MKFAVIRTGGKQYKVSEGEIVKIEKLLGDHKEGDKVVFEDVLLVDDGKSTEIGTPKLSNKVEATIEKIDREDTVTVIKYKAKSNYFKKRGHRQPFFKVKIAKIS
ncbi:MAG: large subunit ribosomal protein [Patescibacteria group bacterium]|jgi:large subunit ribosomal protein L21|nr:large subunit ribosomal protein [Patescibacteria group bacterium]